jgi:WD40 repeat protein
MNALIIDLDSGSLAYCEGHRAQVNDIQWSSDGSFVFTAGNDGNIGAFRDNGSCVAFATCHFNRVALLATHLSDPHVFVSAGGDETLKLWRLNNENGTIEWHDDLLLPAPRYVEPYLRDAASVRDDHPRFRTSHAVLFSRWRSELLISGTQVEKHGCLDLYDVNCSTRLLRLWAHADMISCVDQNACDPWIVATGGETDNYVRVFDLRTGKRVSDLIDSREKDRPHATINFVQFSPTAPHIVAACRTDCVVEVYDSRKSSCPVHVFRHEKSSLRTRPQSRAGEYTGANHARFSPCGRFLFSCGEDSGVRVWSLTGVHCDNLAYLQTPPQLIAESSALVVGHEGDYVLACSDNGFVHLWSVPGTDYKLPAGRVNNVLF